MRHDETYKLPELVTILGRRSARARELLRVSMPYCVKPLGHDRWVLLNRRYKPLGLNTTERLDYEPYAVTMALSVQAAVKMDWRGAAVRQLAWPSEVFLYNDGCDPTRSKAHMTAYLARVAHLLECQRSSAHNSTAALHADAAE